MKLYGVFIRRNDGTEFLAHYKDGSRAVFSGRKDAAKFKAELKEHDMKAKVKPCTVAGAERTRNE